MKLWILFEVLFDERYYEREGLGRALGACFDEEQAAELKRTMTIAHWRARPDSFANHFEWTLKSWGYEGVGVKDLDDETLVMLCDDEKDHAVVEVIAVDVDALPKAKPDRRRAMAGLVALLRPWSADAAAALEEDT